MFYKFLNSIIKYGKIRIIEQDGKSSVIGSKEPYCSIKLHKNNLKRKIFINPELYIGEAFVNGDLTIEEGTLENFMDIITYNAPNISNNFFHRLKSLIITKTRIFHQLNFIKKSILNVAHHYDINEEVYKLFLDKDMQYSCAYFHNDNISLEQAQIDKKKHIINKLNIKKKNMEILDIGSGWGGLSIDIAKRTNSNVTGISLSKNQIAYSNKRAKELKINNLVDFKFADYRDMEGKYDRIVSVGMFEHVGVLQYKSFFKKIKKLLKDDGIMLLHSIGHKGIPEHTNAWIRKYIFPGGYIPALSEVIESAEKEGLWINDVEILRLHYAKTLRHWRRNFNSNRKKITSLLDEKFCRMWEFYLLASEYSFRNMGNKVFQLQISKNQQSIPLTRNYLYT